jgi:hypothetical protein
MEHVNPLLFLRNTKYDTINGDCSGDSIPIAMIFISMEIGILSPYLPPYLPPQLTHAGTTTRIPSEPRMQDRHPLGLVSIDQFRVEF